MRWAWLVLCAALWSLNPPGAWAASDTRPTGGDIRSEDLFDPTRLWTIHLRIGAKEWEDMQPVRNRGLARLLAGQQAATRPAGTQPTSQPSTRPAANLDRVAPNAFGYEYVYIRGSVEFEGREISDVAIRFKGNSSYSTTAFTMRRPFKLSFDRYAQGRRLAGVATLNLHNNALDPSRMREALSYEVYRRAGVPASRTGYALVYLTVAGKANRECIGLYTLVEEVDEDEFLKHHFGTAEGLLLKPEQARDLAVQGDSWDQYVSRYRPKAPASDADGKRIVEWIKLIHQADDATFRREIKSYLDVDEFLRFLAATAMLANMDSFLSTGHNFYLYLHPQTRRISWIPWDLNLSFGSFNWVGSPEQQANLSIMRPYAGRHRLIERLLEIEEFREAYRQHIRRFTAEFFNAATLHARVDALQPVLTEADARAKAEGHDFMPRSPGLHLRVLELKPFVQKREESLLAQLDGRADGYVPDFTRGPRQPDVADAEEIARALMRGADADASKEVSEAELQAGARAFFEAANTAKKGSLDMASIAAEVGRLMPVPPRGALRALLRAGEDPARQRAARRPGALAGVIMKQADADNDGRLTLGELTDTVHNAFERADKDKDGELNAAELLESIKGHLSPQP